MPLKKKYSPWQDIFFCVRISDGTDGYLNTIITVKSGTCEIANNIREQYKFLNTVHMLIITADYPQSQN